jgi:hypothetical protein
MLTACGTFSGSVGSIAPLNSRDAAPCKSPSVAKGQDARAVAARMAGAFASCRDKHGNVVRQYNDVRNRFGGK